MHHIPELLAPAGSHEALLAAIEGGADAVYMGGDFNARAFARNFDRQAIKEAIRLLHLYGIKAYITLNTLVFERELREWLEYAAYLWDAGADAFITADLGAALTLKKYIPQVRLHASTQMSVHNSEGVKLLSGLGFERVVVARELSGRDISSIVKNTDAQIEMFVHGALCVSASGQCLFSSLVGNRSGNRGECAQPCRLSYNRAPILSLKDNCLASHITEILSLGVSSLKIEGRMKAPEYVYGTVRMYRELLDKRRNADAKQISELERLFCRSGFTDGYFVSKTDGMCGVRTEQDKKKSGDVEKFEGLRRKIPISIRCEIKKGEPMRMSVCANGRDVCVHGPVASEAQSAPIDEQTVKRSLTKLGATAYECESVSVTLDNGLYVRVSELNALRRDAICALEAAQVSDAGREEADRGDITPLLFKKKDEDYTLFGRSARFVSKKQLCDSGVSRNDISRIYLPLEEYDKNTAANGVLLPPLVYDSEWEHFERMLGDARRDGAEYAICSNISQLGIAAKMGYTVTADFRLNCTNPQSAAQLVSLGADEIILSPELKVGAMRDIHENKSVIVYGKIPVMLTQKCPIKECGGCSECKDGKPFYLRDRTGAEFAAFGISGHRCVIYNSIPTYTADCETEMRKIGKYSEHMIFSDESGEQIRAIIASYREHRAPRGKFRRI